MSTATRSSALVFKHPNTLPAEHRVEMMSKLSAKQISLEESNARLQASQVSAERAQHKLQGLQGEVKDLRKAAHAREKELQFYRNAAEEGEQTQAKLAAKLCTRETELHRAKAATRTLSTRPGNVTALRHERAQERLTLAAEHAARLQDALAAKDALVSKLEREAAMLKREANLLAQALDVREAVGSGSVDGASIFVESAKLKEQVKAMALGAAEKSGEVLRLHRELEDTKMTMAAQHAVELETEQMRSRKMAEELASLRLERTAMLEHTANMAQRHTKKVTAGGDDRRKVLELQRKVETQTATIQSLLEMKKRLLVQAQQQEQSQQRGGGGDSVPNLMGSLEQTTDTTGAESFRTAGAGATPSTGGGSGSGGGVESLRQALDQEKARADREARSVTAVRQELAGLHGDIGHLQSQLLEAQHVNLQNERAALSSIGEEQSAAAGQVGILEQENGELIERLRQMSSQNALLAQQAAGKASIP